MHDLLKNLPAITFGGQSVNINPLVPTMAGLGVTTTLSSSFGLFLQSMARKWLSTDNSISPEREGGEVGEGGGRVGGGGREVREGEGKGEGWEEGGRKGRR